VAPELNILFELSNCGAALQASAPVVEELRRHAPGIGCGVVSFCEFLRAETDERALGEVFDAVHLPARRGDVREPLWVRAACRLGVLPDECRRVFSTRRRIGAVLREAAPDVVVVANDRAFPEFDLVRAARRAGVPTLLMQESVRKDLAFPSAARPALWQRLAAYERGALRHGEGGCTRVAAWGPQGADYFRALGLPEQSIAVTGSPRMDAFLARARGLERPAARRALDLPEQGRVVLFATNPVSRMGLARREEYLEALRAAVDAAAGDGFGGTLLVKPHPLEREDHRLYGIAHACALCATARHLPEAPLVTALAASDAVLVFNSTVALEAALMERPVGIVNLHGWQLGTDFAEHGLAVELTDAEALARFIRDVGPEPAGRPDVGRYVQHVGEAAARVAEEVLRLAEGKR
jgi:hypothetical protein